MGFLMALPIVLAETELPEINTLPNSPLYGLSRAWERVRLWFSFDEAKGAEMEAEFALKRLAEADAMEALGKSEFVPKLIEEYESGIKRVNATLQSRKASGLDVAALNMEMEKLQAGATVRERIQTGLQRVEDIKEAVVEHEEDKVPVIEENGNETADEPEKSSDEEPVVVSGDNFTVTITENWKFEPMEIAAKKGTQITITFKNENPADHEVIIGDRTILVSGTETITIDVVGTDPIPFYAPTAMLFGHTGMIGRILVN